VIHGTHTTLSLYYAKFPNYYLADIVEHGSNYLKCIPIERRYKVHLRCTKRFHMRVTKERVELFYVLAKLLYYLSSGKAHVGYLFDYERHPMHQPVSTRATYSHC
jgi:hypothetical protein